MNRADPRAADALDEEEDEAEAPRLRVELGGYRTPGGLEQRAIALEGELLEARATLRGVESELYAARRAALTRRRLSISATGGLGSLCGSILGGALYAFSWSPYFVPLAAVVGFVVAGLGAVIWERPDSDTPAAPPPTLTHV
jgi:hypothetical protein